MFLKVPLYSVLTAATLGVTSLGYAQVQSATNPLVLVNQGRATSVIVLSDTPTEGAKAAAEELRGYLRKISDADVPVKTENALSAAERAGSLVLVGDSTLAKAAGLDTAALKPEGFLIKAAGNRLVLAGRETQIKAGTFQQGTSYAVTTFLEDELGVRWLWPGASGEVIAKRPTIALLPMERRAAPVLVQRSIRNLWANTSPRWSTPAKILGLTEEQKAGLIGQSTDWLRRQRIGRSAEIGARHAFTDWYEKYYKDHPEWFALHLNGSREWPLVLGGYDRAKLCLSNPEVLEKFATDAIAFFKANPTALMVSAAPNDNAYSGNCMCERCKSWDEPNAAKYQFSDVNAQGERIRFEYPYLTDRHMRFYNLAAERIAREVPGKLVGGLAYTAYLTPPLREKLRPDVAIGFVGYRTYLSDKEYGESVEQWNAWAKTAKTMFLRPNTLVYTFGFPLVFTKRLAADIKRGADDGMIGTDYDSLIHHWGGQGINYYVLAKMLWNPQADVNAIVDDYCRTGFGPAAPAIRAYFRSLEQITDRISAADAGYYGKDLMAGMLPFFTPEVLNEAGSHLVRARTLAGTDAAILERIKLLETGLEYARLQTTALRAVEAAKGGDAAAKQALARAIAARQNFYRANVNSFAINATDIMYNENGRIQTFFGADSPEAAKILQQIKDEEG
jgi:hypothetical protein